VNASQDRTLLAAGDAYGRLSLVRFPGEATKMPKASYRGHAGSVSDVCFSFDDDLVVSGGGEDRCLLQWQRTRAAGAGEAEPPSATDAAATTTPARSPAPAAPEVDFVYGASSETAGGVAYSRAGDVVYTAGSLGLVFSKQRRSQCQASGHGSSAVRAMASSPDARFAATGDADGNVVVWDPNAGCEARSVLPKQFPGAAGIAAMAFSADGRRLVAVGADVQHTIVVWDTACGDWTDGAAWAVLQSGPGEVRACTFLGPRNDAFATVGAGAPIFWQLHGQNLTRQVGDWGAQAPPALLTAAASISEDQEDVVFGATDGRLLLWQGGRCVQALSGHDGAVTRILPLPAGGVGSLSSGDDGHIKVWRPPATVAAEDGAEEKLGEAELLDLAEDLDLASTGALTGDSRLAAIAVDSSFTKVLALTRGSEVWEIVWDSRASLLLVGGHAGAGVTAPAPHPTDKDLFATGGNDGWVKIWAKQNHEQVAATSLDSPLAAVGWSAAGDSLVAVGTNGRVYSLTFALDTLQLHQSHVVTQNLAAMPKRSIAASEDGKVLQIDGGEALCDAASGQKIEDAGSATFPATADEKLESNATCVFQLV